MAKLGEQRRGFVVLREVLQHSEQSPEPAFRIAKEITQLIAGVPRCLPIIADNPEVGGILWGCE